MKGDEPVVHKYQQVSDAEDTAKVDNDKEKGEEGFKANIHTNGSDSIKIYWPSIALSSTDSSGMKDPVNQTLRIAGVVAIYWFVSITLVFVNKKLLSGSSTFSAPLFVTWFQCVVTVALLYLLQALFAIFPRYVQ